jgi:hypothetical protein
LAVILPADGLGGRRAHQQCARDKRRGGLTLRQETAAVKDSVFASAFTQNLLARSRYNNHERSACGNQVLAAVNMLRRTAFPI